MTWPVNNDDGYVGYTKQISERAKTLIESSKKLAL